MFHRAVFQKRKTSLLRRLLKFKHSLLLAFFGPIALTMRSGAPRRAAMRCGASRGASNIWGGPEAATSRTRRTRRADGDFSPSALLAGGATARGRGRASK